QLAARSRRITRLCAFPKQSFDVLEINSQPAPPYCHTWEVAMADPTLAEVAKQVTETQTGVNFSWTLICGFLVMFMQAGFAFVETGLVRAKNVAHTMGMNIFVYAVGIIAFWAVGFGLQMGGVGALGTFGGDASLNHEFVLHLFGKDFGLFGLK